ncbi:MAG: polysaccharide deacetylase [Lachnospiraceae bacterium]|nr:polysaccharide deacetylase [Lachnospiraceae bacterium]
MSENKKQAAGGGKRRQKLKQCNVQMLVITIVMLALLCSVLIVRTQSQSMSIKNLTAQIELLSKILEEERTEAANLREELQAAGRKEDVVPDPGAEGQAPVQREDEEGDIRQTVAEVTAAHKVYLTFDDGPGGNTQDILDVLEEYGVKATFFVVGKEGEANKENLNRIVEAGHTLGMHSGTHNYAELYASIENFAKDFEAQRAYLYEVTGVDCTIYRFPGGSSNTVKTRAVDMGDLARYLEGQGVRFFDWNISSGDGGSVVLPVETLVENCTKNIGKFETSIILMHDSTMKSTTLQALPKVIEKIQAMEDTVILPITEDTTTVQHITW